MIRLGQTDLGHMMIFTDEQIPKVKRVVYYREQKLFTLTFVDPAEDERLMEYEVSREVSEIIKLSPEIIIVVTAQDKQIPDKYLCPLVQVGI